MSGFLDSSVWSDALSEHKFKPWWETIRSHVVAILFASAFFLVYDADPEETLHCRPPINATNTLTEEDTAYMNSICFSQVDPLHANIALLSVIDCIMVYFCYSWWLMIPRVTRTFAKIRQVDDRLNSESSHMSAESLILKVRQICFNPDVPDDLGIEAKDASLIADVCSDLWIPTSKFWMSIRQIYLLRNLSALVPLIVCFIMSIYLIMTPQTTFTCYQNIAVYTSLSCTHSLSRKAFPFLVLFAATQGFLVILNFSVLAVFGPVGVKEFQFLREPLTDMDANSESSKGRIGGWYQFRIKEQDNHFVKLLSRWSTTLSRKTSQLVCITNCIMTEKELIGHLNRHFAGNFVIFYWDLERKVFLDETKKYRSVRRLAPRVAGGQCFKQFISEHRELFRKLNDPESHSDSSLALDFCRCKDLSIFFKKKSKQRRSLFRLVIEEVEMDYTYDIIEHFLRHFPVIKEFSEEILGWIQKARETHPDCNEALNRMEKLFTEAAQGKNGVTVHRNNYNDETTL